MKKYFWITLLASILLPFAIFYPYSIHLQTSLPNAIDPLFYTWNLAHNARSVFMGLSSMLNTNMFYPLTNTIAFSDTLWAQSLFTSPVIWLTQNAIFAQNALIFISFPLSTLSMFTLARYLTKNDKAALLSGLLYAFSYPRISQIGHLPMICSQWLPLYFLALFQFMEKGKPSRLWLIFLWYTLSLGSSIYFGILLLPATCIIFLLDILYHLKTKRQLGWTKSLKVTLPITILMGIILLALLFPYIRLKIENPDIKRSIDDVTFLRATLRDYIQVSPTSVLSKMGMPVGTNEHVLFPLLTVLVTAGIGIWTLWKKNKYILLLCLGVILVSFVLSLGNEQSFSVGPFNSGTLKMPYFYLYYIVPIFQIIRVPARFSILVTLGLTLLGSFGLDYLTKKRNSFIVPILVTVFLIEIWQTNTNFVTIPSQTEIPRVYQWIKMQPQATILAEVPLGIFYRSSPMEKQLFLPYSKLEEKDTYAQETYRLYFSIFHHKRMINGYSGYFPATYNTLAERLENFPSEISIQDLKDAGVTHIVVHMNQFKEKRKNQIRKDLPTYTSIELVYNDDNDAVYRILKK